MRYHNTNTIIPIVNTNIDKKFDKEIMKIPKIDKKQLKWYAVYFLVSLFPGAAFFQHIFEVNLQLPLPIAYFFASMLGALVYLKIYTKIFKGLLYPKN